VKPSGSSTQVGIPKPDGQEVRTAEWGKTLWLGIWKVRVHHGCATEAGGPREGYQVRLKKRGIRVERQ